VDAETSAVAVVSSQAEADEIARALISNGLSATVSVDDDRGPAPARQPWNVRVLVAKSDETFAREVLAAEKAPGVAGQCGGD
jgi:hypothetical protein